MSNKLVNKSQQELADGLELYLKNGYIDPFYVNCDCFDEGAEEAMAYLDALLVMSPELYYGFCKKIMESNFIDNDLFKSHCMRELLFSSTNRDYVKRFLIEHTDLMSNYMLQEAMFYFYCAKNDPQDNQDIPNELILKLKHRYWIVKNDKSLMESELRELSKTYHDFSREYP